VTDRALLYNPHRIHTRKDQAMFDIPMLPESPPDLDQQIKLSAQKVKKAQEVLTTLSASLEAMPVVLSQEGDLIASAGPKGEMVSERLAKVAARVWREGGSRLARELVRFEEEEIDEGDEHTNLLIYSAHIAGGVTLTVGWQVTLSLTQVRAEVGDARAELVKIIGVKGST
jgi:hypothetical protein